MPEKEAWTARVVPVVASGMHIKHLIIYVLEQQLC
jgi:hypothetical protein